jgi:putative membrane protein
MAMVNELAKERTRGAVERTLAAWIQNCLTLMLFGIVFDPLLGYLAPTTAQRLAPGWTRGISVTFVGLGVVLLALALVQHHWAMVAIHHPSASWRRLRWINRGVVAAVLTLGAVALGAIVLLTA